MIFKELEGVEIASLGRVAGRAALGFAHINVLHWSGMARRHLIGGKWKDRSIQDIIGAWGAGLTWIMGIRVVKRNERQGPIGDLIIANHMGFMDIPVLLSVYPSVFMISLAFSKFPYFGRELMRQGHVFLNPKDPDSRRKSREGLRRVLESGERIIVFPEGRASPGAKRRPFRPFSFFEAKRQGKWVEACILDYEPDRRDYAWDRDKSVLNQILKLFGRKQIIASVEFLPAELIDDPKEAAQRYHDIIEGRLKEHDEERERGVPFDYEKAERVNPFKQTIKFLKGWECWEQKTTQPGPRFEDEDMIEDELLAATS